MSRRYGENELYLKQLGYRANREIQYFGNTIIIVYERTGYTPSLPQGQQIVELYYILDRVILLFRMSHEKYD